jgi:hypothetical protein
MTNDNIEEIKTALAAMKEREASTRRSTIRAEDQSASAQSDLAELKALLAANPDLGKLGEILARRDKRRESLLAQQHRRPDAQETQAAATAATAAINARRQALSILSQPFTPPYYVTLDTPGWFLVLPNTELSIIQDFGIEPGGSWFKALLNTSDPTGGHAYIQFYFVWVNPSDYYAVANVSSSLLLNGWAKASGEWALLDRNNAYLYVRAYLNVIRWSGWGTDPDTGQSLDQTTYPVNTNASETLVANLDGWGGNLFSSARPEQATFNPAQKPYDVSASLILIPGGAVTVFEVGLYVDWSFDGVGDHPGSIILDLADNGYIAQCPLVQLEVLTGPPT